MRQIIKSEGVKANPSDGTKAIAEYLPKKNFPFIGQIVIKKKG